MAANAHCYGEPSWPLDPSLATSPFKNPPPFLSHPCPCPVSEDPDASAPSSTQPLPNPPKCTHHGTGEGSVGSSASVLLWGPAVSPGTQTPGSRGGAAPCAGSRRGTASDWHVPPPGTPALGGREEGKEREGGKGGKKGRGSRREASGSIWGWTKSWSVPPSSIRAPTLSLEREEAGHEEREPRKAKSPRGERRRIQGDKHPHPLHTDWRHTHTHTLTKAHSVSRVPSPTQPESPQLLCTMSQHTCPDTHVPLFTCLLPLHTLPP